jgi:hypothetical protein
MNKPDVELKKVELVDVDQKPAKEESAVKKPTDYFKITEIAMDMTKNANPSVMDHLGVYRGPIFVALVAFFVLSMLGFNFIAQVVGMGLVVFAIVHKLIHMGQVKENLNGSIDSVVEMTKEKLKRKKKEESKKEVVK